MKTDGLSSVLAPAGAEAAVLAEIAWVLIIGASAVFLATMTALLLAMRRHGRRRVPASVWIGGLGIGMPVLLLTALLVYGTQRTAGLERGLADPALVVAVTGRLWWWELRYRDPATGRQVHSANELRMPAGRRVQLGLQSDDVVHSFWVPQLGGKMDLVPGRTTRLVITADRPGLYRGQCAEFCGTQHAGMVLWVRVMPADAFDRWLAGQAATAGGPATGAASASGRQAFESLGCGACHAVHPTQAGPRRGPNLAGIGDRLHLGAGVLANRPGALRTWLTELQSIKPGARMPHYRHVDPATLDALTDYLRTL